MAKSSQTEVVIIRRKKVEARTGLARSTLYDRINPKSPRYDATFPRPISLGAGAVGWIESEITDWIEARINISRTRAEQLETCKSIQPSKAVILVDGLRVIAAKRADQRGGEHLPGGKDSGNY